MGIFVTLIVLFAVQLDQAVFLGDALRVAVITVWADLYYLDTFTCVAGMDLSRFRATSFPLIWIGTGFILCTLSYRKFVLRYNGSKNLYIRTDLLYMIRLREFKLLPSERSFHFFGLSYLTYSDE